MQSIERYAVIALVFLAVTVVAVIMFNEGDAKPDTAADPRQKALLDEKLETLSGEKNKLNIQRGLLSRGQVSSLIRRKKGN